MPRYALLSRLHCGFCICSEHRWAAYTEKRSLTLSSHDVSCVFHLCSRLGSEAMLCLHRTAQ